MFHPKVTPSERLRGDILRPTIFPNGRQLYIQCRTSIKILLVNDDLSIIRGQPPAGATGAAVATLPGKVRRVIIAQTSK